MDEFKLLEVSPDPLKTLCTTDQELLATKELERINERAVVSLVNMRIVMQSQESTNHTQINKREECDLLSLFVQQLR